MQAANITRLNRIATLENQQAFLLSLQPGEQVFLRLSPYRQRQLLRDLASSKQDSLLNTLPPQQRQEQRRFLQMLRDRDLEARPTQQVGAPNTQAPSTQATSTQAASVQAASAQQGRTQPLRHTTIQSFQRLSQQNQLRRLNTMLQRGRRDEVRRLLQSLPQPMREELARQLPGYPQDSEDQFSSANRGPFAPRAGGPTAYLPTPIPFSSHWMAARSLRPRPRPSPSLRSLHQPLPPWRQQRFPLILTTGVLLHHRKRNRPLPVRLLLILFSYLPIDWSLKR